MEVSFTDRELDVMAVLWEWGSATVGEARDVLGEDLPYTTVLSIFQTLEQKGYVHHTAEGKAYRYHPKIDRRISGRSAIRQVVRKIYGGSRTLLLTQLISDEALGSEELKELRRVLDRKKPEGS